MSDINDEFEKWHFERYEFSAIKDGIMQCYESETINNMFKGFRAAYIQQQAEIQRLNAIIKEMQQVDDVLAPQNEIDAKRYRWLKERAFLNNKGWVFYHVKYNEKPTTVDDAIDESMKGSK